MTIDTRIAPVRPPLDGYYSRIIAYLCAALTFSALLIENGHRLGYLVAILYTLAYPQLAQYLPARLPRLPHLPQRLSLLALDALHTGVFIALLGFNYVPSLMFVVLLGLSCLIAGGPAYLAAGWLLALAGALLGAAVFTPEVSLHSSPLVTLVSLISGGFFILVMAAFVHRQGRNLELAQQQVQREQEKTTRLAANLSKYLSPQVWESIFSGKRSVQLETRRKKLTVFFSDIRGFTELAEELEAEALTDLLNNYLDEMSRIALQYGGTIDKFVGDCVMVFFGDPKTQGAKQDAEAKEGGIGWVDNFAISSGAKHVDAAHKMIDFLLRPEVAEQISRDTGYLTAVAESNAKFKDVAPLFPSQQDLDRVEWQDSVGDLTTKYEEYFLKLKAGQ